MTRTRWVWLILAVVYAAFFSWYTSFGGPLTQDEIDHYLGTFAANDPSFTAEREAFEKRETARLDKVRERYEKQTERAKKEGNPIPKAPKLTPKPFRENPWKNQRVVCWDGDQNAPVQVNGTHLSVPIERHNFRLLLIEKQ